MSGGTGGGPSDFLELTSWNMSAALNTMLKYIKRLCKIPTSWKCAALTSVHKKSDQMFDEKYKLVSYLEKVNKLSENV